jgi:hypothetical protein
VFESQNIDGDCFLHKRILQKNKEKELQNTISIIQVCVPLIHHLFEYITNWKSTTNYDSLCLSFSLSALHSPDAFDFDALIHALKQLKRGLSVEIPIYDFKIHGRFRVIFSSLNSDICFLLFEFSIMN